MNLAANLYSFFFCLLYGGAMDEYAMMERTLQKKHEERMKGERGRQILYALSQGVKVVVVPYEEEHNAREDCVRCGIRKQMDNGKFCFICEYDGQECETPMCVNFAHKHLKKCMICRKTVIRG